MSITTVVPRLFGGYMRIATVVFTPGCLVAI